MGSVQESTAAASCQCTQHSEPLTALRRPGHRCAHTEHRVLLVSGEEALQENEGRPPVDDASIPGRVHVARASWEECLNCTCQSVQRYRSEVPPVDIHLPNPPVPLFFSNQLFSTTTTNGTPLVPLPLLPDGLLMVEKLVHCSL